eukprot:54687_1
MMMVSIIVICSIIAALAESSLAFVLPTHQPALLLPLPSSPPSRSVPVHCGRSRTRITSTVTLSAATNDKGNNNNNSPVEITFPTPEAAASMGMRDWPQQFHSTTWSDSVSEGSIATRYVLDGKGRVTIDYYDDDGVMQRIKSQRVYTGTLVEVDGEANLTWEVDDEKEGMIVLTP